MAPEQVVRCVGRFASRCRDGLDEVEHSFKAVARCFPKAIYEHLCGLLADPAFSDVRGLFDLGLVDRLPFGSFEDTDYLNRGIEAQWKAALVGGRTQEAHLALLRSLLWSDPPAAPARLEKLVSRCGNAEETKLAVRLAATQGSRFVFTFPQLVGQMLGAAARFGALAEVRQRLLESALGGGRTYDAKGVPGPEYRYLREQSESLATRHRDDPLLGALYQTIAATEREGAASVRRESEAGEGNR